MGFSYDKHHGRSRHSTAQRKEGIDAAAAAEQEFWGDTISVIMSLLWWHGYRRQPEQKQMVAAVAEGFFAKTIDVAVADICMKLDEGKLDRCTITQRSPGEKCPCVENFEHSLQSALTSDCSPQKQLVRCLLMLVQRVY